MMKTSVVSIYRYIDPARYLNDALVYSRSEDPGFSLRKFAIEIGLTSGTVLSRILRGECPIPAASAAKISRSLQLAGTERKYFQALVGMSHARTRAQQEKWIKKAEQIYESVSGELEAIEQMKLIERPILAALLALVERKDFKFETGWIQRRLKFDASAQEIQDAFHYLVGHGFLAHSSTGQLTRTRRGGANQQKKLNEAVLVQAARAVYQNGLVGREFYKNEVPRARKAIRTFTDNLIRQLAAETGNRQRFSA